VAVLGGCSERVSRNAGPAGGGDSKGFRSERIHDNETWAIQTVMRWRRERALSLM
jgi:hypothetical protein